MDKYMDIPAVRQYADRLETIGRVLGVVSDVLEAQANLLDTTAFIGNVGGAVVARYIRVIQPAIEELAQGCIQLCEFARTEADQVERAQQGG